MAISLVLDHFRAVNKWAIRHQADAQLDMKTFQLSVQCGGRAFRLHPMFPARTNNQFVHMSVLTDTAIGFGGWLPYRSYRSRWSTDKLLFKRDAVQRKLRTPLLWESGVQPTADYILKRSQGSFGYDLTGPYRAGCAIAEAAPPNPTGRGEAFGEQFVEGRMVKVWFWGAQAFFAHVEDYPMIVGDGSTSALALAKKKINEDAGAAILANDEIVHASLIYQGVKPDEVLAEGRRIWIDFRYGRSFQDRRRPQEHDSLPKLREQCGEQLDAMGAFVVDVLRETAEVPLMTSVDAVLDASNRLWWLEMNTNSILPHHGYDLILSYLFDRPNLDALAPVAGVSGKLAGQPSSVRGQAFTANPPAPADPAAAAAAR